MNPLNLSLKLGGQHVYTVFAAGAGRGGHQEHFTLGVGLGVHLPVSERFFVDTDVLASSLHVQRRWDNARLLSQLRVIGGFQVAHRFAFTVGPTLNVQVAFDDDALVPLGGPVITEGHEARVTPGLQLGVRI